MEESYFLRGSAAGCFTPLGRPPCVFLYLPARNDKREGALMISLVVALAVATRLSDGDSTGGGYGACSVVV